MLKTNSLSIIFSRNIQRGRDHGIPGYIRYREECGLSVPIGWDDKPSDISQENWDNLRKVYLKVEDIDAFTGKEEQGVINKRHILTFLILYLACCIVSVGWRPYYHYNNFSNQIILFSV